MDHRRCRRLIDELCAIGPLADHYAYAPELGLALREQLPLVWGQWKETDPRWRPRQADGLAFVSHLDSLADLGWVERSAVLIGANPLWAAELVEALRFAWRPFVAGLGEGTPPLREVSSACLYAPGACLHFAAIGDAYPELAWAIDALPGARRRDSRPAERDTIALCHPPRFVDAIERYVAAGRGALDADTPVGPGLAGALRAGAGALVRAVCDGLEDGGGLHLCAVRPGSHHAGIARPMGTCVFNNLAIGAAWALEQGLHRVAIVDFDAHHGNGTREIFAAEERVLTISIHQDPLYPSTAAHLPPATCSLDLALAPGSGPQGLAAAWSQATGALERLRPQLILVEASFDAHEADQVAELGWRTADYARIGSDLGRIAATGGAPLVCEVGSGLVRATFQEALNAFAVAAADAIG